MSRTTRSLMLLSIVLAIAAWLRFWRIETIPPGFHFDEAFEGLEAWRILTEPSYRPIFLTGNFGVPPLNAYANALTFALFQAFGGEAGPTAMRVTAGIFGLLGILALYALSAELRRLDARYGQLSLYLPLLAAASLAVMRWHIHFSRMGIEPVIVPLIWAASLWLLLVAWRTGRWAAYVGTGLAVAAGMYAYQGAWIIPFLVAAAALHLLVTVYPSRRADPAQWTRRVTGLAIAGAFAVLCVLPLAWFFRQHPDLLFLRPAQLAIVGETGSPADSSLADNVSSTVKMFAPFGAVGDLDPRRNLPGAPVLNVWQAVVFYIGLAVAVLRVRRPAYSIAVLGLVGLLLPGVFSEYAPHFHRVLGASAPVALICGIGLDWLWQRVAVLGAASAIEATPGYRMRLAGTALVLALIVAAAVVSVRDYFVRWAVLPDLYYAFDEGLWELGQWTAERSQSMPVYITPRGADHATIAFAWRKAAAEPASLPVSFDGRHIFPFTVGSTAGSEAYTVIEHEDFRTRLLLPEVFPDAVIGPEFLDRQGGVYARVYERPSGTIPARQPQVKKEVLIGDGIRVAGYDVLPDKPRAGESLYLQLHWIADAAPQLSWTVFTHVVDPGSGQVWAGYDSLPGAGSLPTQRWQPGWRILDEYEIPLPIDLPAGEYELRTGLYRDKGERLPADKGSVVLGDVTIEGAATE